MAASHGTPITGSKGSIGATALRVVHDNHVSSRASQGLEIKADAANTGIIYVGTSTVTANSAEATDGFPIAAGATLFFPVRRPEEVFVVSSATGDKVFYVIV